MAKKPTTELDTLSSATEAKDATLHGVVAAVSPIKKGSKAEYFDAKIADGQTHLRVVGFRKEHRKRLAEFEQQAVSLTNCQIKKSRTSEDLEIVLQHNSRVEKSPRKIVADIEKLNTNPTIRLSELKLRKPYDRVSVMAKVVKVKQPVHVSGGLTKQDITIADETGRAILTLWEKDVETLTTNTSYHFNKVTVREYQGSKYLSFPKNDASISSIADIGDISDEDFSDCDDDLVHGAEIIGVLSLQTFWSCLMCKAKVVQTTENFGSCTKCQMDQKLTHCSVSSMAKLLISSGTDYHTLNVFDSNLKDIAEQEPITTELLLAARPFTFTYANNVITTISRPA